MWEGKHDTLQTVKYLLWRQGTTWFVQVTFMTSITCVVFFMWILYILGYFCSWENCSFVTVINGIHNLKQSVVFYQQNGFGNGKESLFGTRNYGSHKENLVKPGKGNSLVEEKQEAHWWKLGVAGRVVFHWLNCGVSHWLSFPVARRGGKSSLLLRVVLQCCHSLGSSKGHASGGSALMLSHENSPSILPAPFSWGPPLLILYFLYFYLILCFFAFCIFWYFYLILGCYWTMIKLLGLESTEITNIKANCSDAFLFDSLKIKVISPIKTAV